MTSRFTCEETFRRLNDYLDRELSPDEARLVEEHLTACAQCASEYRFEGSLLAEIRNKIGRLRVPEGLKERIAATLAQAERDQQRGA